MPFSSLIYSREAFTFIPSTSSESYSLLSSEPDLRHFIYYLDFKLLLCATCKSAVSQDYIKGHIFKHISTYKGKAKVSKATSFATTLLSSFEVKSVSKSLELVLDFQATIDTFFRFQELETTSFYKCITCSSLFRS
jgi:DNA-directed RNA polymerase subunit RPC12/RpoP